MFDQVSDLMPPWVLVGGVASVGVSAVVTAMLMRRRGKTAVDGQRRKISAGTLAAAVAFVVCTSVSLNTSYRFTFDGLDMTGTAERVLSCAAFEALIAMCVLGARERMASNDHTPGWYGTAVWIFAALSSVPAWHEGGGLTPGTVVRIIVGSFGSALSAHAALGLELKHRTGGTSQSPGALIMREIRERAMARLGLIERGRDAEQITRDRYMDQAVELADEYDRLSPKERKERKGRRVCAKLARAMDRAGCAEPERRKLFDHRLSMRRDVAGLPDVDLPATWTAQPTPEEQAATTHLTDQIRRMEALAAQIEADGARGPAHAQNGRQRTAHHPDENEDQDEEQDEEQDEHDEDETVDLRTFPTKVGALRALYDAAEVETDDERTSNAIAVELLEEMRRQGIEYDRGAACRAVTEWRQALTAPQQPAHEDRELAHA